MSPIWHRSSDRSSASVNLTHYRVQRRGRSAYYESYVVYSCPNTIIRRFKSDSGPF